MYRVNSGAGLTASLDVAIIDGGPAGLTAAATFARQVHTVVVFDNNVYRDEGSYRLHTVPGWDHKDPKEFRATSRQQIKKITILYSSSMLQ